MNSFQSVAFVIGFTSLAIASEPSGIDPRLCRPLVTQVTVDGVVKTFAIDTGAQLTVVDGADDRPALQEFRSSVSPAFSLSNRDFASLRIYYDVPFAVVSCESKSLRVHEIDLLPIPELGECNICGLVGMNYIHDLVLSIPGRDPCTIERNLPEHRPVQAKVLKKTIHGLNQVSVQLPAGMTVDALVDTGFGGYLMLSRKTINALTRIGHIQPADSGEYGTVQGKVTHQHHVLRWLQIGSVRFVNVPVAESDMTLVGIDLLRHLKSLFDFPNQKLYFEPVDGKSPIECEVDASGLRFTFDTERRAIIRRFRPNYPAEKAGIAIGDELLAVDNIPVAQLSIHEIDSLLCQGGKTVHLELKSGERTYDVELLLSRPFEYPPKWVPEWITRVLAPQE